MTIRACSLAFSFNNSEIYSLKNSFRCQSQHSFSAIYATSIFLLKNFPEIIPPVPQEYRQQIMQNITTNYNPLYEYWNDYLVQCAVNEMCIRSNHTFNICIPLDSSNIHLVKDKAHLFNFFNISRWEYLSNRQKVSHIFSIPFQKYTKKIGIYLTQPTSKHSYKPYLNKPAIYLGIFFNNQKWQIYDILKGEVPQVKQFLSLDSIIITGSSCSVLNQSQNVVSAVGNLIQAYRQSNKLKIFGFCYGHQLIAKYFGAQIAKKDRKSSLQGIHFQKQIVEKYPFLQPLKTTNTHMYITEDHQDYVETIPQGFDLLAKSSSCKVQAVVSKDGRIFTTQFHSQILFDFIKCLSESQKHFGIQLEFKFDQQKGKIEKSMEDSVQLLKIIQTFIDR